jgi:phosphoglycerol transferase MdoB-like AlkP superfamily enzyme
MEFFKISYLFELIALVTSLFLYKKLKGSFLQWMPLFLFFIFYGEMGGAYFFYILKKPNSHIYLL